MSGHSKWSSIKHKKAITDARRGQAFTKVIREITVAARAGGSDVEGNARLRMAVQAARDVNMPKETIERAIKKGAGGIDGVSYEDVVYEGYGPAGVAVYVEASTDNKNRSAADIRHLFSKYNGNLGEVGCVGWMFKRRGQIMVPAQGVDEDALMEAALEAGADDVRNEDDTFVVLTEWSDLMKVRGAIEEAGIKVESATVAMTPGNTVKVEGKDAETLIKLINALEESDDVRAVSANYEIEDALLEKIMA
ncbi:MAG TPA: YebC/PmpR family DNA-binding transcriptional regulator [Sumerlaeia bacterium]|nr:YebC/PmpR family DNA-binding transcriptional regulator [Sumerlaeia bacterium]